MIEDLTGKRFGRLTVIERSGSRNKKRVWKCLCDCGNYAYAVTSELKSGHVKSCGCYRRDGASKQNRTHGMSKSRLYGIWTAMKARCYNPHTDGYYRYGALGITVCDDWLNFIGFYNWAMSNGYADDLSIERIDISKGYSPDNCKWIPQSRQSLNTCRTRKLEYNGKSQSIREWADEVGLDYSALYWRICEGWDIERALTTPSNKSRRR